MTLTDLPLYPVFDTLRGQGFPLGVDDYMALLRALQAGFGVDDRAALADVCCALWAKSADEARHIRRILNDWLAQVGAQASAAASQPASQPLPPSPPPTTPGAEEPAQAIETRAERLRAAQPVFDPDADALTEAARALRHHAGADTQVEGAGFHLRTDYFPVTMRQMKQSWRHLRRRVREGPAVELDVPATVEKVSRAGVLDTPVLRPRRINRAGLVILIDRDGSMVPFHGLTRQLLETARRGGRLSQTGVFYFHDYPDESLYLDPARRQAAPIADVLARLDERTGVLIVSDAGAARGRDEAQRVARTRAFINQLRKEVRHCAWLNPMPRARWANTSAQRIARFVPMFEMSRPGLDAAVNALRGRYADEKISE